MWDIDVKDASSNRRNASVARSASCGSMGAITNTYNMRVCSSPKNDAHHESGGNESAASETGSSSLVLFDNHWRA